MNTQAPRVSVIMRSKNSDWVIAQALNSLFSQTYSNFELIIVDSGSSDKTLEIANQYPCKLIKIHAQDYYPGAVLNMAISETSGEIIVFQNSDCVLLIPQTLERLISAFSDPEIAAAYGRQLPRPEAVAWVKRDYASSFPDCNESPDWITLSLPLAAMRRQAWEKHRFYTDAWASEDTEWGFWASGCGLKIKYMKDALVMHSHNYSLSQIFGRRYVEGEADAFIYRKKSTLATMLKQYSASVLKDIIPHLKDLDLRGLCAMPVRRFIYHYAHHKGHKFGEKRIRSGNNDASAGQCIVLNH
jgi:rhamnosyltransferase